MIHKIFIIYILYNNRKVIQLFSNAWVNKESPTKYTNNV